MEAGEANSVSNDIKKLQVLVDELFAFRDNFFESHSIDEAVNKEAHIQKKLDDLLKVFSEANDDIINKAEFLMLKGRALNVTSAFNQESLDLLTKAVKLDPKLVGAWVELGECYWKKKDVEGAKNCFLGALNHTKNKVALRNLSMVLRQVKCETGADKIKTVEESVDKAKEAVSLDIQDGMSWFVLGNAYLSLFFATHQSPDALKKCMSAYQQAEKHPVGSGNADLHFNRATAYKYQEEYESALQGFSRAAALDPSWPEPQVMEQRLLQYLSTVHTMVDTKGKQKGKKLQSLIEGVKPGDLGAYSGGSYTSPKGKTITLKQHTLHDIKAGLNPETVVIGKVVCSVAGDDPVPFTFCMVDSTGTCVSCTIYNVAPGYGVKIGDSVAIPEPFVQDVAFQYKSQNLQFRNIRIDSPVVLVVNGRKLGLDKQAPTVLDTSVFSE